YSFQIQPGQSFSQLLNFSLDTNQLKDMLYNGIQSIIHTNNGREWRFEIIPYRRNSQVVGGIVIFKEEKILMPKQTKKVNTTRYQFSNIVTQNKTMLRVIQLAKKAAFSDQTILINGETGTGKEVLSQSIHSY